MVGYFKSSGRREAKIRQKRDARRKKSESTNWDYRTNPYTGTYTNYIIISTQLKNTYTWLENLFLLYKTMIFISEMSSLFIDQN